MKAFNRKKWGSVSISSGGSTSIYTTITSTGRPLFVSLFGDNNATSSGAWHYARINYKNSKDSTYTLATCLIDLEDGSTSQNKPFCASTIIEGLVSGLTYDIQAVLQSGSGSISFTENGELEAPEIIAFEI